MSASSLHRESTDSLIMSELKTYITVTMIVLAIRDSHSFVLILMLEWRYSVMHFTNLSTHTLAVYKRLTFPAPIVPLYCREILSA